MESDDSSQLGPVPKLESELTVSGKPIDFGSKESMIVLNFCCFILNNYSHYAQLSYSSFFPDHSNQKILQEYEQRYWLAKKKRKHLQ